LSQQFWEAALEFQKSTVREYFESIVITAIIALFATTFTVQAFKIPTGSMETNLLIGDHLLVNKFVYGLHSGFLSKILPYKEPRRGDVIVFKYPNNTEVAYVKRLIGMPGDIVQMMGHTVYINGKPLKEDYTRYISPDSINANYGPYRIPNDQYFAMGDNRDNSLDCRFWCAEASPNCHEVEAGSSMGGHYFGTVPRDYLLGKALVIYWSFETPSGEYLQTGLINRTKQFADVILNFFTKTRWSRTFKIIH
jgi:signal peptidase I